MKTLFENCEAEIIEKKSKFICNLFHVENKEEAEEIISRLKKEYYDARHNCYAYIIYDCDNNILINKTSDDGEPSGTAGFPILNALKSEEMVNTLAIVTRYFGGVLLGTGGLARAYKQCAVEAIKNATLYNVENGYLVSVELRYENNEIFKHFCKKNNISIIKSEYLNNIKYYLEINEESYNLMNNLFVNNNIKCDIIRQKMIKTA